MRYDNNFFKNILNSMNDLVLVKGDKSKLLWANKSFLKCYGMTVEELYNLVDSEHSDPDDTLQYVKDDEWVFKNAKTLDIPSEPVNYHDGKTYFHHTVKTPIFDKDNNVIMGVGVSRKINDKVEIKESEDKRLDRHEIIKFQKDFIHRLRIPALFLDARKNIITASEAFLELLKVSLAEFKKIDVEEIFISHNLEQLISHSGLEHSDIEIKVNESSVIGTLTITPWFIDVDTVGGSLLFFKDRTEENQLRQDLELQRKEAIISDKMKSLGEFAAGVGHEINNPLAIISGKVEILNLIHNEKLKHLGLQEEINSIKDATNRISKIVKSLKSISRDASEDEFSVEKISSIIENVLSLTEGRLSNLSIEFQKETNIDFSIRCRPSELTQVILNLINNAIDEILTSKTPWLKIQTYDDKNNYYVAIVDSGPGIPQEVVQRMFEPFYTTKAVGKGTGLGLGISTKIIENHGGTLYVDKQKENTTFVIKFPKSIT
jgi:PAS domain S-box-containing protein